VTGAPDAAREKLPDQSEASSQRLTKPMSNNKDESMLRPLSPLEQYAWLSDQASPKHFSVSAQIRGYTTIESWRSAINSVQLRHPLLRAGVNKTSDGILHFYEDNRIPIPLRVVRRESGRTWEQELEREYAIPFGTGDIPLVRVALLYGEDLSNVIVTLNHSIADGRSAAHLIRDILDALAGKALQILPLRPSHEEICDTLGVIAADIPSTGSADRAIPYVDRSPKNFRIRSSQLTSELSNRLRARARSEETTVHGAITAAFSLAIYRLVKWSNRPARVLSAIDTRKALNMDYELGFCVLFPTFSYDLSNRVNFWDLARKITQDIAPFRTTEVIAGVFGAFKSIMSDATVQSIAAFESRECSSDVVVTNLGVLPFPTDYGSLTLEGLWGPSILFGTEGENTIGVATMNDSIHLLYTSFASHSSLLETGEQILLSSLEGDE
jgi:hypothetical protein